MNEMGWATAEFDGTYTTFRVRVFKVATGGAETLLGTGTVRAQAAGSIADCTFNNVAIALSAATDVDKIRLKVDCTEGQQYADFTEKVFTSASLGKPTLTAGNVAMYLQCGVFDDTEVLVGFIGDEIYMAGEGTPDPRITGLVLS
jgi:hypothetical protein